MQEAEKIWMNGVLVDWADAQVHVLSHGLHYGTTVFEGIRSYDADEGHGGLPSRRPPGAPRALGRRCTTCRSRTPARSSARRSTRSSPPTASAAATSGRSPCAATARWACSRWRRRWTSRWPPGSGAPTWARTACATGIRAKISSWRRIGSSTIPATAKAGGQYLNSILAKIETHKAGYQEAILLNEAGYVADGSGENLFLVRDGVLITPPVHASILEGITRASIITLAADEGIPVLEREVARGELYHADEVFITGTAAEVCPVNEVDDHAARRPRAGHAGASRSASSPRPRAATRARPSGSTTSRRRRPTPVARDAHERARPHLRHHPARRDAARGPEPVRGRAARRGRCAWPSSASSTSRPASPPATPSTASSSACSSARTWAPPASPPSA